MALLAPHGAPAIAPSAQGTLMVVFQPAEETAEGSDKMIKDGLTTRFPKPDVILGQHLLQYRLK